MPFVADDDNSSRFLRCLILEAMLLAPVSYPADASADVAADVAAAAAAADVADVAAISPPPNVIFISHPSTVADDV